MRTPEQAQRKREISDMVSNHFKLPSIKSKMFFKEYGDVDFTHEHYKQFGTILAVFFQTVPCEFR
jgi:hypothetical protein